MESVSHVSLPLKQDVVPPAEHVNVGTLSLWGNDPVPHSGQTRWHAVPDWSEEEPVQALNGLRTGLHPRRCAPPSPATGCYQGQLLGDCVPPHGAHHFGEPGGHGFRADIASTGTVAGSGPTEAGAPRPPLRLALVDSREATEYVALATTGKEAAMHVLVTLTAPGAPPSAERDWASDQIRAEVATKPKLLRPAERCAAASLWTDHPPAMLRVATRRQKLCWWARSSDECHAAR